MAAERASDAALIRRFRAGDDAAFDTLCDRYRKSVYTACYAILAGEDRATALAALTFATALRELRGGQVPGGDVRVWLRGIAYRLAVQRADPRRSPPAGPVDIDPEWHATSRERGELIWDGVNSLSLSHRKVLSLLVPQELEPREIAGVLGLEPGRAQRLVDDARRELQRALAALVVARSGRRECPGLDRLLSKGGWTSGPFAADTRLYRKVSGHIGKCAACGTVRARDFVPRDWLTVVIPLLALPDELRQRILEETQELVTKIAGGPGQSTAAMTSGSALVSTGAGPLNRLTQLAQGGRAVVTTTATRVAATPGISNVIHLAHNNPGAKLAAVLAAMALAGPFVLPPSSAPNDEPHTPGIAAPHENQNREPHSTAPQSPDGTPSTMPAGAQPLDAVQAAVLGPLAPPAPEVPPAPPLPPTPPQDGGPTLPDDPGTGGGGDTGGGDTGGGENGGGEGGGGQDEPPPPLPPRWGAVFMSRSYAAMGVETALTGPYQAGTWRSDPSAAKRVPTVTHQATGRYQVRMPGIGSDTGVPHVTVGWWGYYDRCSVRGYERDKADELVTVGCSDASGMPKDVNFHLFFGDPGTAGTPAIAFRSSAPGEHATVARLDKGRFRATINLKGLSANGFAAITALGETPAWCQNAGTRMAGENLEIDVNCYNGSPIAPADTEWVLSYVQGTALTHDTGVPGAYAQTTLTAPALKIDPNRSYNSTGGAMTILRDGAGTYLVGMKGVAAAGNGFQVVPLGPNPGFCRVYSWVNTPEPAGEVWIRVACTSDIPFGVAVLRGPGTATGPLEPTPPPATQPAGPRWAHARVGLLNDNTPLGLEVEVDPDEQWGSWVRSLSAVDARWARRATAIHEETGGYLVRLPGAASAIGVPQVSIGRQNGAVAQSCDVRSYWPDGADELVRVVCFSGNAAYSIRREDAPFSVVFAEPGMRYTGSDTGAVHRDGPGRYSATVDGPGLDGTGYAQITPYLPNGDNPVWCQSTDLQRTGTGVRISIGCWDPTTTPARPRDAQWFLSYAEREPLSHDPGVPGAYLRTTPNPPLAVDPDHSYNSTGGPMRVLRNAMGNYLVGIKGAGGDGNTFQVMVTGPTPGHCIEHGADHYPAPGEVWVHVLCFDTGRRLADLPFVLASVRSPYGPIGDLSQPRLGPYPPGPSWGFAAMNATDIPTGVETGLHPGVQWGTWLGTLSPYAARWLAQSTVVRESTGVSLVRMPNIGSEKGIPHVTVGGAGDTCAVRDFSKSGTDELVRVNCFDGTGKPKDVGYAISFGEPGADPSVFLRSDAPGTAQVTQVSQGRYLITADDRRFTGNGYAQITPLTDKPTRCQNAGVSLTGSALQMEITCHDTAGKPVDSAWLITYVQGTSLTQDTRQPGAYGQTSLGLNGLAVDTTRSWSSTGGPITLVKERTGGYRMRFAGLGRAGDNFMIAGDIAQVVTLGGTPGYCRMPWYGHQDWNQNFNVVEVQVACYDPAGKPADIPFGVAILRRP